MKILLAQHVNTMFVEPFWKHTIEVEITTFHLSIQALSSFQIETSNTKQFEKKTSFEILL